MAANRLVQIVSATEVAPGASVGIAIALGNANVALIPDTVERENPVFTVVSCTATLLTVRNDSAEVASSNFLLTYWHTYQREFGNNATPTQLTPAPFVPGGSAGIVQTVIPQRLLSTGWSMLQGVDSEGTLANNQARLTSLGYAWRNFAIGESFSCTWELVTSGVDVTWGEIALVTGPWLPGTISTVTPVGFANVQANLEAAPAAFIATVVLAGALTAGDHLWAIMAAASTTTAPIVRIDPPDTTVSGLLGVSTTAGWRPSENIGVAKTFALSASVGSPRLAWGEGSSV